MIISVDKSTLLNKRSEIISKCRHKQILLINLFGRGYPAILSMHENTNAYVYFVISVKAHDCNLDGLKSEHV